jgi:hypothetical protein
MAYLMIDDRERDVIPHLKPLLGTESPSRMCVHRVHTGDYLIGRRVPGVSGTEIVACFERKSLKDFVSSFKDGRYENRRKMLELRDKTGCQLYYIVEGPAFPSPSWVVCSGTKYQSILSAMTTLPLASGIHIIQTKDTQHTALRLRDFVLALDKVTDPYKYPVLPDAALNGPGNTQAVVPGTLVPEMVTGVYEKDPDSLCMELWAKLTGVSVVTAKMLVEAGSVHEFLTGQTVGDIAKFKTAGGRLLVKKGRESLTALRFGTTEVGIKVLSGVHLVSPKLATEILEAVPGATHKLRSLCAWAASDLAAVRVTQKSRTIQLGRARADRILKMLHWKSAGDGAAPTADAAPPVAVPPPAGALQFAVPAPPFAGSAPPSAVPAPPSAVPAPLSVAAAAAVALRAPPATYTQEEAAAINLEMKNMFGC